MPASKVPLYSRIQESLRTQIASGHFGPGQRLPSESELAQSFSTTRMTVRQALAQLAFEGIIVRRSGDGTFVSDHRLEGRLETQRPKSFEEQTLAVGARLSFRLLEFDGVSATKKIAENLHVNEGDLVYRLRRLRVVDGDAISLEDRYMLARIGTAVPATALVSQSALEIVEAALGAPIGGMIVVVGTASASTELAGLLNIPRKSPVLSRTHTFFDSEGRAILVGDSFYRGDKYRFTYSFGRTHPS